MVLRALQHDVASSNTYTIVALSYRDSWTSRGRPSERGIGLDAVAAIDYATTQLPKPTDKPITLLLWGQSISAGVATTALANLSFRHPTSIDGKGADLPATARISGLLLETPFTLLAKPRDSRAALQEIASSAIPNPKLLILQAANDELVPSSQSVELEETCRGLKLDAERIVITGALHTDVATKSQARRAIVDFLRELS
ncbi:MAG: hypothetical protein Q9223_007029 [Gallowayella weberi]